jgi:hypothetical protein
MGVVFMPLLDVVGSQRCNELRSYSLPLWESWVRYSDFHERKPEDMPLAWLKCWLEKRHPELKELIQ